MFLVFLDRPNVQLDYGNFLGGSKAGVESFTGIPYVRHIYSNCPYSDQVKYVLLNKALEQAEPPINDMRLSNPIPPRRNFSNYDATVGLILPFLNKCLEEDQ